MLRQCPTSVRPSVWTQESEAKDCHYHYHLEASFSHLHKGAWKNASAVQDWLASIFARQAKGEILGLGPERATPQETDLKGTPIFLKDWRVPMIVVLFAKRTIG
jgi:hypothetical protein